MKPHGSRGQGGTERCPDPHSHLVPMEQGGFWGCRDPGEHQTLPVPESRGEGAGSWKGSAARGVVVRDASLQNPTAPLLWKHLEGLRKHQRGSGRLWGHHRGWGFLGWPRQTEGQGRKKGAEEELEAGHRCPSHL